MFQLSDKPFAQGGHRAIYFHPGEAERCIKVLLEGSTAQQKKQKAVWWKKLKSQQKFDDNQQEYEALSRIAIRVPAIVGKHIPRCYGFVETNQGKGLVTDLYRDFDDEISLNLITFLQRHGMKWGIEQAIEQFQCEIYRHQVLSRALLLHNIVVQRVTAESCQLFLIDGIGNPEFIPISNYFFVTRKLKIRRKINIMSSQVEKCLRGEPW